MQEYSYNISDAVNHGYVRIMIRMVDSDVLVVAIAISCLPVKN